MKLLDRYIFQKFFGTLVTILSITILLIILIHITEHASYFKAKNLSLRVIAGYYSTLLPYMVNLLTPIIVFATTIWVTTRLAQRSEIIALLSSGISFHRIALPYTIIGIILTAANFYLTGWLLATANKERVKFESQYEINNFSFQTSAYTHIHLKVGPNQYLYIHNYQPYLNTGYNISLDTFQENTLVERLQAKKMQWNSKNKVWRCSNWKKIIFLPKKDTITKGYSVELTLDIDPEDVTIHPTLKEGLTLPELNKHIQNLINKGNEQVRFFIAEKYIRYMTPFAILILIILGFLVAVHKRRGGASAQITLGFILACLYISLFLSVKIGSEAQLAYPLLKIWMPNILFSILCIIFYRLAIR